VGVVLACLAAWPLAQTARQLGGPLPWVSASLVGALGIAIGILVAWPQRVRRGSVLGLMVAAGLAGGLLFTAAGELGLVRSGRSMWSVVLLCSWQAGLLTAAAFTLRRSTRG
jgi:hypothetical protein